MAHPLQDCVLLLGDSLTQGQESHGNLQEKMNEVYVRKLDIINRGFAGYNTEGIRVLLDSIFAKKDAGPYVPAVRLITIWLGTNDATLPLNEASLPLPCFVSNLNYILTALTSPSSPYAIAGTPVSIILITPGPIAPSMFPPGEWYDQVVSVERTREFKDAVLEIGDEWKRREILASKARGGEDGWQIETLNLWDDITNVAGDGLEVYFTDGIHLSTKAYKVLWESIVKIIKGPFRRRGLDWDNAEDLPLRPPAIDAVDWKDSDSIVEGMKSPRFGDNGARGDFYSAT